MVVDTNELGLDALDALSLNALDLDRSMLVATTEHEEAAVVDISHRQTSKHDHKSLASRHDRSISGARACLSICGAAVSFYL